MSIDSYYSCVAKAIAQKNHEYCPYWTGTDSIAFPHICVTISDDRCIIVEIFCALRNSTLPASASCSPVHCERTFTQTELEIATRIQKCIKYKMTNENEKQNDSH